MQTTPSIPFNILVCGSRDFDHEEVVWSGLNAAKSMIETEHAPHRLHTVWAASHHFAGVSAAARRWCASEDRGVVFQNFFFELRQGTSDLNTTMADAEKDWGTITQAASFLREHHVRLVLAFPNPTGVLGIASRNIHLFSKVARVPFIDFSDLLKRGSLHGSSESAVAAC